MPDHIDDLVAVENALRLLVERIGLDNLTTNAEMRNRWQQRQKEDTATRGSGFADARPLFYSDISDLKRIITHVDNWGQFEPALRDKDEVGVLIEILRRLRNPSAHNRQLSTHESELASGISGELRMRIARYLSTMDTRESAFPRITSFQCNLGGPDGLAVRIGDELEFAVEASDPKGGALQFHFQLYIGGQGRDTRDWSDSPRFVWRVGENDVGRAGVTVLIRSVRAYHYSDFWDDVQTRNFLVLPPDE